MKGKTSKFLLVLLALVMLLMLPCGCRRGLEDPDTLNEKAKRSDRVHGASSLASVCIADAGAFYIEESVEGKLLSYYDYDANERFVLCSNPECDHEDEECAAFRPKTATLAGFGCYDGSLWLFQQEVDEPGFSFVRMDVNCENQTVVAAIPAEDGWEPSFLKDVWYSGDFAWIHAQYVQFDEAARSAKYADRFLAVRLSDGEVLPLSSMLTQAEDKLQFATLEAVSDSAAAWRIQRYDALPQTEEEYAEQNGDISGYEDYLRSFEETVQINTSFWMASEEDMEPRQIDFPGTYITDLYQGKCLGIVSGGGLGGGSGSSSEAVILYDPDSGTSQELLSIENGGCLGRYLGEATNLLLDGDRLLYLEYQGEDRAKVSCYSMAEGTAAPLFEDAREISFRIAGETEDKLIGTVGDSSTLVWILKSNYWNGDWGKRTTILSGR